MKKRYLAVCLTVILVILGGCKQKESASNYEPENTIVVGTLNHGVSDTELIAYKEDDYRIQYSGEEVSIQYDIQVSGEINDVGLLLFVDGIAQPYKTNLHTAYQYLHEFHFKSGDDNVYFTLMFSPVTGTVNSESTVTVLSLTNPNSDFDATDFRSVGHEIVKVELPLYFVETPHPIDFDQATAYQATDFDTFQKKNVPDLSEELKSAGTWTQLLFNDVPAANMRLDNNILHITYEICDMDKVSYRTTFYLNHQPVFYDGLASFSSGSTEIGKEVLSMTIETAALEKVNMFYVISIPIEPETFTDNVKVIHKTDTVLLQKDQ